MNQTSRIDELAKPRPHSVWPGTDKHYYRNVAEVLDPVKKHTLKAPCSKRVNKMSKSVKAGRAVEQPKESIKVA